jgi:hypothetical protein
MRGSLLILLACLIATVAVPGVASGHTTSREVRVDLTWAWSCVGAWYEIRHVHVGPVAIYYTHCTNGGT